MSLLLIAFAYINLLNFKRQTMKQPIGFIGLGNMGLPMASNLIDAGYKLKVYNRTAEKAQPLIDKGAELAETPADVVTPGGIVITMLPNDDVVESTVLKEDGILPYLGKDGIHLSMSTLSPATANKLAQAHQEVNAYYLASPVLGRPDVAQAGQLNICLSGNPDAKKRVQPLLEVLGQKVYDFGDTPESANVVKLSVNFSIAAAIEAMAEAFTLAEKNGIDRTKVAELFGETLFSCPVYQGYGKAIAQHKYEPAGFKLSLGLKDLTLALQAAHKSNMPMPLASLVYNQFLAAMAKGRGNMDWAAIALEVSEAAGVS